MSTDFITEPGIPMRAFRGFDHRGVRSTDEAADSLVLTDGTNSVLVCTVSDEDAPCFTRTTESGDPAVVLEVVADFFKVRLISEYDDEWHDIVGRIEAGEKQSTKPPCPKCGSLSAARIMYGLPHYCKELREALGTGRLVLGGCVVELESPAWRCNACGHSWGRLSRFDED